MTYEEKYNYLAEHNIATEDEIDLVCRINGCTEEQLENILFIRTGYLTFDSYDYYEGDEYDRRMMKDDEDCDSYLNEYTPEEILEMIL